MKKTLSCPAAHPGSLHRHGHSRRGVAVQDVPDRHWASDAVDYVVEKGLFNGTSATTFSPTAA